MSIFFPEGVKKAFSSYFILNTNFNYHINQVFTLEIEESKTSWRSNRIRVIFPAPEGP